VINWEDMDSETSKYQIKKEKNAELQYRQRNIVKENDTKENFLLTINYFKAKILK
jgi:hypothetical protein